MTASPIGPLLWAHFTQTFTKFPILKKTKTSKILTKYASKIYPQTYTVKAVKFQKFMYPHQNAKIV